MNYNRCTFGRVARFPAVYYGPIRRCAPRARCAVEMGADAPAATEPSTTEQAAAMLTQLAPAAQVLLDSGVDVSVETLQAKVANLTRIRDRLPEGGLAWTLYDNRINTIKAKLRGMKKKAIYEKELKERRRGWSSLGRVGVVTAIVAVASLTAVALRKALKG